MSICKYIKVIGRGKDDARALNREQAYDLFSQVLDGTHQRLEAAVDRSKDFTAAHMKRRLIVEDKDIEGAASVELLDQLHADPALTNVPGVVFTGKGLSAEEQARLKSMAVTRSISSRPRPTSPSCSWTS